MASTNHYDLIVLGSDLAGLVAAALVAHRGKRVLVIPHGSAEGTYRLGPATFSLNPAPVVHITSSIVQRTYEELGLWTQLRRERRAVAGMVHWVYPSARLDLGAREGDALREARRAWPDDPVPEALALQQAWTNASGEFLEELLASEGALTADGFWGRRFLARIASRMPGAELDELRPLAGDHPLRSGAHALDPWYLHLTPAQVGKAASLRLGGLWGRRPQDCKGGEPSLRRQLLQRVQLKSGDVKPGLQVGEVLIQRGKAVGVSLLGKRDRYGCDRLLIAADPLTLLDGPLPPAQLPRPLLVTLQGLRAVARRFVLHLEVGPLGLSPALDGVAICLPANAGADASPHGIGTTYLRLAEATDDGARRLSVTRILAEGDDGSRARQEVLAELDERGVLPFVHDHARFVHSPHDGREAADGRGRAIAGSGAATAMRLPMTALYQSPAAPTLGLGLLPHTSGIKHLFFASRLTLPGLGLEGEFAAGWAVAGAIAASARPGLGRSLFVGRG